MGDIFPSDEHRSELLMRLKMLGVAKLQVEFAGSGDSGSIEGVTATAADGAVIDLDEQPTISWVQRSSTFDYDQKIWVEETSHIDMSLEDILSGLAEQALEDKDIDWYNNDGGQGTFEIDFTESPPRITLNVGVNVMSVNEYSFDFSGTEDEEEEDAPSPP